MKKKTPKKTLTVKLDRALLEEANKKRKESFLTWTNLINWLLAHYVEKL